MKIRSIGVVLCMVDVAVLTSLPRQSAAESQLEYLRHLRGADLPAVKCDCDNCKETETIINECYHPNPLNPKDKCSTTQCLVDWVYWPECPEKPDGGDHCPTQQDDNAVYLLQQVKNGAPAACNGVDQAIVRPPAAQPTRCRRTATVECRCIVKVGSCGGAVVENKPPRRGRRVCMGGIGQNDPTPAGFTYP